MFLNQSLDHSPITSILHPLECFLLARQQKRFLFLNLELAGFQYPRHMCVSTTHDTVHTTLFFYFLGFPYLQLVWRVRLLELRFLGNVFGSELFLLLLEVVYFGLDLRLPDLCPLVEVTWWTRRYQFLVWVLAVDKWFESTFLEVFRLYLEVSLHLLVLQCLLQMHASVKEVAEHRAFSSFGGDKFTGQRIDARLEEAVRVEQHHVGI